MKTPFDCLYQPCDTELMTFGENWCGPKTYEHGAEILVAKYESSDESDGQSVDVYCTPMPARFYTIRARQGVNSVGEPNEPWEFGTGSGMAQLAADIAKAVSEGMPGFHATEAEATT